MSLWKFNGCFTRTLLLVNAAVRAAGELWRACLRTCHVKPHLSKCSCLFLLHGPKHTKIVTLGTGSDLSCYSSTNDI